MALTDKIKQMKQTKTHSKPASLFDSVMIVVEAADPGSITPSPDLVLVPIPVLLPYSIPQFSP